MPQSNHKKRILFIHLGPFRFLAFLYLKNLSEILAQNNIEVYLATSSLEIVSLLKRDKNLTTIKLPPFSFWGSLLGTKDILLLIRFLAKDSLLILQSLDYFSLFVVKLLRFSRKTPLVYFEVLPSGETFLFRFFQSYLYKPLFSNIRVITPLRFFVGQLEKEGIEKPLKVGLSFAKLPPLSSPSLNRAPVFGFLGDLTKAARVDIFLRTCGLLAREGLDFKVAICGVGREEIYLRRLTKDLEIESRVNFYKNIVDFEKVMLNFWLMVLPNYYYSALAGLLFAQAMAIPVIAARLKPFSEIIIEGENGYLVEPENPLAFKKAILDLLSKNKRDKFGFTARKLFIENHQSRFLARSILAFYEEFFDNLLKNKNS